MTKDISGSYNDFRETASDFGEEKGHDYLTDPSAVAAQHEKSAEESISHGSRLRTIRESKGFTIQELSEKTGIPADRLESVETGNSVLPLGQLIKISKALSLRMSDVISSGEEPYTIVRADERRSFSRFGKVKQESRGYEYESLAPDKKDRMMEPFIVTLKPADDEETSSHDGQEFIYVLEGEMEVIIGDDRHVLKPGDSIYYDSSGMHMVKAYGDKPAKILAVLTT